jgi:fission process protein 1
MLSAHRYVAYTSDIGESFRPIAHPYLVKGAYGISWLYLTGDVAHEGYKAYVRNQKVLHPENYLDSPTQINTDEKENRDMAATGRATGVVEGVKKMARNATSAEGVKYGGKESVVTGGEVVPGRIPAIEDYRAVMAQRAIFQAVASMGLPAFTIHSIVRYSGRALKDAKNKTLRTWGPIGVSIFDHRWMRILLTWCVCSLVWQRYLSYRICSMSRSSMRRSGCSTTVSS